ncbi:oligosaccharide flippase family protein [Zhongshania arctica]|uniref:Oligosaccharide flippase family protein n=1 Tax=Zhongshania arctica TaxID=3238302 RepID=A0ABV3TRY9_9GAMM
MGAEAYGLVGFFAMLQAWFNLLDMGLTPTMARETARFRGGALDLLDYRRLARALEGVFCVVAIAGGLLLYVSANWIAASWLNANELPMYEVATALEFIAVIVSLRWMCGLYRGVISGSERLVWLSGFNSLIATLRFVLVLPVLMFFSATPVTFFIFQLGVAVVEVLGLVFMAYQMLPAIPSGQQIRWQWAPLKPVLKFSLSIAFTSSIWVLVTQIDKLILSKILPLADYGYFTVAALLASGIMIVSGPVSTAIMPRMANLHAKGELGQLIALYRQATQIVTVTVIPITLVLVFFSAQVLGAWTGDDNLVGRVAPVLALYAAGYGVLAVSAFPYYLQYANGDLKLHLIGSALLALILVPSVVWATNNYGMIGAGWAWLISNVLYFVIWTPLVHRRFIPGVHLAWVWLDIVKPSLPAIVAIGVCAHFITWHPNSVVLAFELVAVASAAIALVYVCADRLTFFNRG